MWKVPVSEDELYGLTQWIVHGTCAARCLHQPAMMIRIPCTFSLPHNLLCIIDGSCTTVILPTATISVPSPPFSADVHLNKSGHKERRCPGCGIHGSSGYARERFADTSEGGGKPFPRTARTGYPQTKREGVACRRCASDVTQCVNRHRAKKSSLMDPSCPEAERNALSCYPTDSFLEQSPPCHRAFFSATLPQLGVLQLSLLSTSTQEGYKLLHYPEDEFCWPSSI